MRPPRNPNRTTSSFRGILSRGTSSAVVEKPVETEDLFEKPHRDWSAEVSFAREYFHLSHFKEILEIKCKFDTQDGACKEWAFNEGHTKLHADSEDEDAYDEADEDPLTMFDVAPEEHKPAGRWTTPNCDCALGGDECIFQDLKSESESRTPTRSSTFSSQDGLSNASSRTSWSIHGRQSQKISSLESGLSVGSQTYLTMSPGDMSPSGASSPRSLRSWFTSCRTSSRRSSARLSQQSITMSHQSVTPAVEPDFAKALARAATESLAPPSTANSTKSWLGGQAGCRTSDIYRQTQLAERPLSQRPPSQVQQSFSLPTLNKLPLKRGDSKPATEECCLTPITSQEASCSSQRRVQTFQV